MTDEQIIARIRLLLGNIDDESLPDAVIQVFLDTWKFSLDVANHPERMPVVVYNTLIACVRWLIAQEIASGAAGISERLEKIGDETISIKGGSTWASWKDFLDWLLLNPDYVDPSINNVSGLVIIGGTRRDEFCRVKNDPNSRNGYAEQGIFPRCNTGACGGRRSPFTVYGRNH